MDAPAEHAPWAVLALMLWLIALASVACFELFITAGSLSGLPAVVTYGNLALGTVVFAAAGFASPVRKRGTARFIRTVLGTQVVYGLATIVSALLSKNAVALDTFARLLLVCINSVAVLATTSKRCAAWYAEPGTGGRWRIPAVVLWWAFLAGTFVVSR